MHPTAAEAARLARRIQAGDDLARAGAHGLAVEVRLDSAEGLAGDDVQLDGDERPLGRILQLVGLRHPDQLVAAVVAGLPQIVDLGIFREGVVELAIAVLDLLANLREVEDAVVDLRQQLVQGVGDEEVLALVLECFNRLGGALAEALTQQLAHALAGEVGVLLAAREGELLLDDRLRGDEPRVVMAGRAQVPQRAEGVEPREERHGQAGAGRIQPEARGARQDADAVALPHRREVGDALDVVPHPVAVDEVGAGLVGDAEHAPVDVRGNAAEHVRRSRAHVRRPQLAHEVVVAADAAAGDDGRVGGELEGSGDVAVAGFSAAGGVGGEDGAARPGDGSVGDGEGIHAVAEEQGDEPVGDTLAHDLLERLDNAGAGAPGDVEARHRVAVAVGGVAPALCPADNGKESHAALAQPGALLAGGELQVGLGPLPRPVILVAVEAGAAEPVLPGELEAVLDAHAALLGGVDEEEPAERPPGLAAEAGLGLLLEHGNGLARGDELRGSDEAGEARSDDDRVRVGHP